MEKSLLTQLIEAQNYYSLNNSYVKSIRSFCFVSDSFLTNVNFPKCETIGNWAFEMCSNLSYISFPECSVIKNAAFINCFNLESVNFPKCQSIGQQVFANCSNLSMAIFPKCNYLEGGAFRCCTNLISVSFSSNIYFRFGEYYNYSPAFESTPNLKIFNGGIIGYLPSSAFAGCYSLEKLSSLKVSYINNSAFYGCNSLSEIILLTASCNLNNSNCFNQTPFIDSSYLGYYGSIYVIPTKVESFKQSSNWSYFSDRIVALDSSYLSSQIVAYEFYADSLSEIPSDRLNVEEIGCSAFYSCQNLTNVNLPNCKYIASYAFYSCSSLSSINLSRVEYLGNDAFANCSLLNEIYIPDTLTLGQACFYSCTNLISVTWPNVSKVPSYMFAFCRKLSNLSFLQTCTEIDNYAFDFCSNIFKLDFPNLRFIGDCAFRACRNIHIINLPNLISINWGAFSSMGTQPYLTYLSLNKLNVGGGLSQITKNARYLSMAYMPNLTQGACFTWCSNLRDIWAPKLSNLVDYCFSCCYSLSELYFDDVQGIDNYGVFYSCSNLSALYLAGSTTAMLGLSHYKPAATTTFSGTPILQGRGFIYVKNSLVSQYQQNSDWAIVSNQIKGLTDEEFFEARERIKNRIEAYPIPE